ncbi:threonylcarbamoyl-AMP synthase [Bacillus luteolus]|uniref:Threonylcarbamoyl-AMP synthase n=1 Tax=Litchfieldia luteola TaxID=682179 RepID=A0ABR9QGY7_9BACI|nr:L-threonylcarbamoyladenylate synthase [Cytobacillus luteolus]MBE4907758.1 threonylcarbamoyl-AMP synthase [Cytobacillus luteolus]MBP1944107.1 L-threonylcarbamoyladenylate synthase [Cytobacillus luteolus]
MNTKIWTVNNFEGNIESFPQIQEAAKILKDNEVVAFPTETVYGLGANALSDEAVAKIFEAKGRPSDNPLIVHIATKDQLTNIAVDIPDMVQTLVTHFWPGPLTLVLKKKDQSVGEKVTAGLETVAVRMPDHPIALALLKAADLPLAAPSANLSGKPSPTSAKHVIDDLEGRIAGIIDGGATGVGLESTVLDCTEKIPVILRPGGVTKEQLEEVIGEVRLDRALLVEGQAPKSPGMKYIHYAPIAPLVIVEGSPQFIQTLVDKKTEEGLRVGVLTTEENKHYYKADAVLDCGMRSDLQSVASKLYDVLRTFDMTNVDFIYSEWFPQVGVGQAIMNRLLKAAGNQVISE